MATIWSSSLILLVFIYSGREITSNTLEYWSQCFPWSSSHRVKQNNDIHLNQTFLFCICILCLLYLKSSYLQFVCFFHLFHIMFHHSCSFPLFWVVPMICVTRRLYRVSRILHFELLLKLCLLNWFAAIYLLILCFTRLFHSALCQPVTCNLLHKIFNFRDVTSSEFSSLAGLWAAWGFRAMDWTALHKKKSKMKSD